jgi:hypothetical protein
MPRFPNTIAWNSERTARGFVSRRNDGAAQRQRSDAMRLAIWNNPLVTTSFLLRMRRGSLYTSVVIYLLFWGMAGMGWWYYVQVRQPNLGRASPILVFFMAILIVQTGLSAIIAATRAAAAMKNEVMSKTLDFQRIAAVSPWDIMLGKLFGEPAIAYLLAIATVPLGVFCVVMGINGIGPLEVFLLYVVMLTTAVMFGAMSLQHRLQLVSEKSTGAVPGFGTVIGLISAACGILASAAGGFGVRWINNPWAVALIGLFTPVPIFWGTATGDPWGPGLALFDPNFKIPFLIVTPLAQIAVALLCVHIMARRLVNPSAPTLSKGVAYGLLLVVDVVAMGVIQASAGPGFKLSARVAVFCLIHIIMSVMVMGCVTPNRELLETWAWRFRGKKTWLLDEWLGERSLNTLALVTCCLVCAAGVGVMALLAVGDPLDWEQTIHFRGWRGAQAPGGGAMVVGMNVQVIREAAVCVPLAMALSCLIILTFGTLYQWMVVVANKYGSGVFILAVVVFVAFPAVGGALLEAQKEERAVAAPVPRRPVFGQPPPPPPPVVEVRGDPADRPHMNIWLELCPAVHFLAWCGAPFGFPNMTWISLLYGVIFLAALISLRRRADRIIRKVDAKLEGMGVMPPPPRAAPVMEALT